MERENRSVRGKVVVKSEKIRCGLLQKKKMKPTGKGHVISDVLSS